MSLFADVISSIKTKGYRRLLIVAFENGGMWSGRPTGALSFGRFVHSTAKESFEIKPRIQRPVPRVGHCLIIRPLRLLRYPFLSGAEILVFDDTCCT